MTSFDSLPTEKRSTLGAGLDHELAAPIREYAGDDTEFGRWLLVAVSAYYIRVRPPAFVVPDAPWREHYDNGLDPLDAFDAVLRSQLTDTTQR